MIKNLCIVGRERYTRKLCGYIEQAFSEEWHTICADTPADARAIFETDDTCSFIIGIFNPLLRRAAVDELDIPDCRYATLIHPTVDNHGGEVGTGSFLGPFVHLPATTSLGRHVVAMPQTTFGHDVTVESFVTVDYGCGIAGFVCFHEGALVGPRSVIRQNLTIGREVLLAPGSVVLHAFSDGQKAAGNPARAVE